MRPATDACGDGVDEAIGGSWDKTVFAVSGASSGTVSTPLWESSVSGGTGWVQDTFRMPDLDGDGLPDILAGLQDVAMAVALSGRTSPFCVRPASEVADLRASRLESNRIHMTWAASTDGCHATYRVYGVPIGVQGETGCFAQLMDITDQDEDGDASNESWAGPGRFFGYIVVDVTALGGQGPLGHYRR